MASEIPTNAPGHVILNARVFAKSGKADVVQQHLLAVQKHALSDAEPGCLEYRPGRSFNADGVVVFTVWEKYTGEEAIKAHFASTAFQAFIAEAKDIFDSPPEILYFNEL